MEALFEIYMIRHKHIHKFKKSINKIVSFIIAMCKWAVSGFDKTSPKLIAKREAICSDCEHYLEVKDKCLECGCFMDLKRKIKNQSCPVGKW